VSYVYSLTWSQISLEYTFGLRHCQHGRVWW